MGSMFNYQPDLAFDPDGNVCVTGSIEVSSNYDDYVTVKYLPDVSVSLSPGATVVPRGGTLEVDVSVTNNTGTSYPIEFWTNIPLPNGSTYPPDGTLVGPLGTTISPFSTLSGTLSHPIPGNTPLATYVYNAFIGTFFPAPFDRDSFRFTVIPSPGEKTDPAWEDAE